MGVMCSKLKLLCDRPQLTQWNPSRLPTSSRRSFASKMPGKYDKWPAVVRESMMVCGAIAGPTFLLQDNVTVDEVQRIEGTGAGHILQVHFLLHLPILLGPLGWHQE